MLEKDDNYFNEKEVSEIANDFNILQLTSNQFAALHKVADIMHDTLGLDKPICINILSKLLIQEQITNQAYHFEFEKSWVAVRLASKLKLSEDLKFRLYDLLSNPEDQNIIDQCIEELLQWYIEEYLANL